MKKAVNENFWRLKSLQFALNKIQRYTRISIRRDSTSHSGRRVFSNGVPLLPLMVSKSYSSDEIFIRSMLSQVWLSFWQKDALSYSPVTRILDDIMMDKSVMEIFVQFFDAEMRKYDAEVERKRQ